MVFENGVKNIQAAAYNGVRTVGWEKIMKKNKLTVVYLEFQSSSK